MGRMVNRPKEAGQKQTERRQAEDRRAIPAGLDDCYAALMWLADSAAELDAGAEAEPRNFGPRLGQASKRAGRRAAGGRQRTSRQRTKDKDRHQRPGQSKPPYKTQPATQPRAPTPGGPGPGPPPQARPAAKPRDQNGRPTTGNPNAESTANATNTNVK